MYGKRLQRRIRDERDSKRNGIGRRIRGERRWKRQQRGKDTRGACYSCGKVVHKSAGCWGQGVNEVNEAGKTHAGEIGDICGI